MSEALAILSEAERRTLDAYVALLREHLDERLLAVRVYGSVARGERWWPGMPNRSDLDLLVLVSEPLGQQLEQDLLDATYPLFLESGRQPRSSLNLDASSARSSGRRSSSPSHRCARASSATRLNSGWDERIVLASAVNSWPGIEAAARLRQWPRIVELSERVVASPDLAALLIVGSFARGEADALSDVDFIVVVEHGHFEDAWTRRHDLHPIGSACWDYPRPDEREVAAHRWLTPELVLFDGLISGVHGARVSEPLVVLVGDPALPHQMARFDPGTVNGAGIEVHEIEQLYGRLKLAARVAVGG